MTNKKIELLAPAGDIEKLKTAIIYGADAVYFGGELFSLRAGAGNLSIDEIKEAMEFIHEHDAKGYMTINIYPHNDDIPPLKAYLEKIDGVKQKYKITFLYRATGLFSIRQVPQLNDEEEITYYEIEKCYFSEIEAFENTNKVGISTEKYQRIDFQLFLDIFSYYKNVLFYALFFLNCTFYCCR